MKSTKLLFACLFWMTSVSVWAGQGSPDLAASVGISFPTGANSTAVLTQGGKQYLINTANHTVSEMQSRNGGAEAQAPRGNGAVLFQKNCSGCHGADGRGIRAIGTPNFTDASFIRSVSAAEMHKVIQSGIPGKMPPWSGRLSEAEIDQLVGFVRSLGSGGSTPGKGSGSTSSATAGNSNAASGEAREKEAIYHAGDDLLISLPTGRPTDRNGWYVNFTHRFPYDTAFTGSGRGGELFGLDGVAVPSFGVRYGVTDKLSVGVYRSPSLVNRPIQIMAGYNILEEEKEAPLNLMVRFSVEGQNNFRKNYTENIEAILSKSVTKHAQFYLVPTISFQNRPLVQPAGFRSDQILDLPGIDSFALGAGVSVDIRPTVALMAEVIPTFANASDLGIHRPAMSFGIQKKIWRHAFTFAVTNSPGTTVSQRADTRAEFLGQPNADTFGGLTLGFNITRQIK